MKTGANVTDRANIRRLSEQGLDADTISERLRINKRTVESFLRGGDKPKKRGRKPKAETEAADPIFSD